METIFGVVFGAIIAALIPISIEVLRKPKLDLEVVPPVDMQLHGQPANRMRSVRLKLNNKPLPRWARWMYRNPALQCHGNITFHHKDGQNVFGRSMVLRWCGAPEPNPLEIRIGNAQGYVFDPVRITHLQKMDIYPGESVDIDIAARFDDEPECYGWSNESYFSNPPWRTPRWQLEPNRYIVRVTVLSSGETVSGIFRLVNDVGQQDFRLEDALPADSVRD
ncbi:MAG: hypothetical protein JRJ38_07145 [Deltaproteobacteria bacterium]|nr:hypothetical protein [Deltaproteobacteria bacterium]